MRLHSIPHLFHAGTQTAAAQLLIQNCRWERTLPEYPAWPALQQDLYVACCDAPLQGSPRAP